PPLVLQCNARSLVPIHTAPLRSAATHVGLPPGQFWLVETVSQPLPRRRISNPFNVVAQTVPFVSSHSDCTVSNGSPVSRVSSSTARGCTRSSPPPSVPAQMFPSASSHRLRIARCDVGIPVKPVPSKY